MRAHVLLVCLTISVLMFQTSDSKSLNNKERNLESKLPRVPVGVEAFEYNPEYQRASVNGFYCGRGNQVVKVTDSWPACHAFEPSIGEDPPCKGSRCTLKYVEAQTYNHWCGVVWKFG
ncbi:hypothetical protein TNCV_1654841 [Trichonephila clavipes]|nr:hypothetical protein TNCV_1654841 [Trichonephila clavipes]